MPYQNITDLPKSVTHVLPKHAQEIYKAAFNNAFEQYIDTPDGDIRAHRVAWHAVKQKYEKGDDSKWHPKKS